MAWALSYMRARYLVVKWKPSDAQLRETSFEAASQIDASGRFVVQSKDFSVEGDAQAGR